MLLVDARSAARTAADGSLVPLAEQDRGRWDRAGDRGGRRARHRRALERAARALPAPGRDRRRARRGPERRGDRLAADRRAVPVAGARGAQPDGHAQPRRGGRRWPTARARASTCWPRWTATSGSPGTTASTPSAPICSSCAGDRAGARRRLPRRGPPHHEPARAALSQPACGTSLPWMSRTPGRLRPSCASDDPGGTAHDQGVHRPRDLPRRLHGGPEPAPRRALRRRRRRAPAPLDVRGARRERRRDRARHCRGRVHHGPQHVRRPAAAPGTWTGRAGGATIRRTTRPSSSSPTTSASRSRWRAARRSRS